MHAYRITLLTCTKAGDHYAQTVMGRVPGRPPGSSGFHFQPARHFPVHNLWPYTQAILSYTGHYIWIYIHARCAEHQELMQGRSCLVAAGGHGHPTAGGISWQKVAHFHTTASQIISSLTDVLVFFVFKCVSDFINLESSWKEDT